MSTPRLVPEDHAFDRHDLLAPGTLTRPDHIPPHQWERMPWSARWKATRVEVVKRRDVVRYVEPPETDLCGSVKGFARHKRVGTEACVACRHAWRVYDAARRRARAAKERARFQTRRTAS
jgi:hypothetical protein